MKKIILTLLIGLNIFAMSETPTNQSKNSQCKHKAFYENKAEVDRLIAQEAQRNKTEGPTSIKR